MNGINIFKYFSVICKSISFINNINNVGEDGRLEEHQREHEWFQK